MPEKSIVKLFPHLYNVKVKISLGEQLMIVKTPLYRVWKRGLSRGLKKKRLNRLFELTGLSEAKKLRILEVGCANGMDVLQFLTDKDNYELFGVDIIDSKIPFENFTFVQADANSLPFDDNYFDLVISVGLLEHIEPMEKLSACIKEIARVGKAYAVVIPSASSLIEPHTVSPRWQSRLHKKLVHKHSANEILHLNFFTDHTWTKFEGFADAEVKRFYYLFPLIKNTVVYWRK